MQECIPAGVLFRQASSSVRRPHPSGVLPDMLSGIRKVRPRKMGISNPLSMNRLGHFLTADCKSAETPSGAEETYPAGRNDLSDGTDISSLRETNSADAKKQGRVGRSVCSS